MRLFDDKHYDNFGHVLHLKLAKCVKEIYDLFLVFTKLCQPHGLSISTIKN